MATTTAQQLNELSSALDKFTAALKDSLNKFKRACIKFVAARIKLVRILVMRQNLRIAVRTANRRQAKTFKIQMVYLMQGRFVIVERQELKRLYHQGKFKRGLNLRQVESMALYKTKL